MRYLNLPLILGAILQLGAFIIFKHFPEESIIASIFMVVGTPALFFGGVIFVLLALADYRKPMIR